MILFERSADCQHDEWGCPRLSQHGAGWLIDWFRNDGTYTGSSPAKGEVLEWIESKPEEVQEIQRKNEAWREALQRSI